jgi:hypothetical protein
MGTDGEKPQARPHFRQWALTASLLCLLAALIPLAPIDHILKRYAEVSCLFVAFVMLTIGSLRQAGPLFRKLVLGLAIVIFLLAALILLAPIGRNLKLYAAGTCLFLILVMVTRGQKGRLPPPVER